MTGMSDTRTHVTTPALALADVAETTTAGGTCDGCGDWGWDGGNVTLDGRVIGHVQRDLIASRRSWQAVGGDGTLRPEGGNRAHKTREDAAAALVEGVRHA